MDLPSTVILLPKIKLHTYKNMGFKLKLKLILIEFKIQNMVIKAKKQILEFGRQFQMKILKNEKA